MPAGFRARRRGPVPAAHTTNANAEQNRNRLRDPDGKEVPPGELPVPCQQQNLDVVEGCSGEGLHAVQGLPSAAIDGRIIAGGKEEDVIQKSLEEITEADLTDLVTAGVAERKTLDYKQQLPGLSDGEKKEFLADVSSFANTDGGDLVFGVTENAGIPTGVPGVQIGNLDQEKLRWDSVIRTGLAPRIRHSISAVPLVNGRCIFIVRAERSWYGPHQVKC